MGGCAHAVRDCNWQVVCSGWMCTCSEGLQLAGGYAVKCEVGLIKSAQWVVCTRLCEGVYVYTRGVSRGCVRECVQRCSVFPSGVCARGV